MAKAARRPASWNIAPGSLDYPLIIALASPQWLDPGRYTSSPELPARDVDVGTDVERLTAMGLDAVVADRPEVLVKQRG